MGKTTELKIEKRPIATLIPDPNNARTHDDKNLDAIKASLKKFGQVEPLVVRKSTGVIVGGNGRVEAMRSLGWTEAQVVELDLTDNEAKALAIALNRSAELADWSKDLLGVQLQSLREDGWDLADVGFSLDDLPDFSIGENNDDESVNESRKTLAERFGVPPFSVLDARQGYWQERKRSWIGLGIKSEIGRGGGQQVASFKSQERLDAFRQTKKT